ncbi:MAG: hypothetical protein U5L96_15825 [Owenweeksia sp.]|nr:hypothetical protein [Owenweeksia sp.]
MWHRVLEMILRHQKTDTAQAYKQVIRLFKKVEARGQRAFIVATPTK